MSAARKRDTDYVGAVKQQGDTEHRKNRRVQWAAALGTWAAVVAASIYAGVAAGQLSEMRKASRAAVDAVTQARQANLDARARFQQDERPYVWTTTTGLGAPQFVPTPDKSTGQVIWTWHFTNYGKTPAYNVRFRQYISIDGGPFVESYGTPNDGDKGGPLPPTQDIFDTVVSKPGITPAEVSHAIGISGKGVTIKIRVTYTDSALEMYETGICLTRLNTGAIAYCREDNYIK